MSDATVQTGRRAFEAFKRSVETGDAGPLLGMLTEDFAFRSPIPVGEFRGEQVGEERVAALTRWRWNELEMRAVMTPLSESFGEDTAAFEWDHEGTNRGVPYRNVLAIVFEVRGEKISRWREYVSEIDPEAVANAAVEPG